MNKETFAMIENYMISCMNDSAHDKEHIYRVLYNALRIAKTEENINYDILISACLLHDIGREEQFANPKLCHAVVGSEKAFDFLVKNGFTEECAEQVKYCILTHRYRKSNPPQSIEAKILFDADKLDAAGAMGIARTLIYKGTVSEPLYSLLENRMVSNGENDESPSFFQEYKYKLEKIYTNFYTEEGMKMALERQKSAIDFYDSLFGEVRTTYEAGQEELEELLKI